MTVWRKPDASGMACANCHAPDAFDLAYIDFGDANIRRRAIFHVSPTEADQLVAMVQALRARHNITAPKPAAEFRPFQPGGTVLPGATAAERDLAFARTLVSKLPTMMGEGAVIDSPAKALRARDELLAFRLRREPIGVPLARWSEDRFHGANRSSLNDWLANSARVPVDAAAAQELYAAHDAYIAQPTLENLLRVLDTSTQRTRPGTFAGDRAPTGMAAELDLAKYQSAIYAMHLFRLEAAGNRDVFDSVGNVFFRPAAGNTAQGTLNPFFLVSGRGQGLQVPMEEFPNLTMMGLLPEQRTQPALNDMMRNEVLQPWWMLGWLYQPALYQDTVNGGEYFQRTMRGDINTGQRYMVHAAFVNTVMQLQRTYSQDRWASSSGPPGPLLAGPSLMAGWRGVNLHYDPQNTNAIVNTEHDALYRRFAENSLLMAMHLIGGEAARSCATGVAPDPNVLRSLPAYIQWRDEAMYTYDAARLAPRVAPQLNAAWSSTRESLDLHANLCQPLTPSSNGTGLLMEVFGARDFQNPLGTEVTRPTRFHDDPQPASGGQSYRFTGFVTPRVTDNFKFNTVRDQAQEVRIWIDGVELPQARTSFRFKEFAPVALQAGRRYAIRIEGNHGSRARWSVNWSGERTVDQMLPVAQLAPN
jgi:hypothetical protein